MLLQRYDPIVFFDQGGSGLGQMEECPDGDWVSYDDFSAMEAILADPHKVMINMLHGTIAWTPETLRRVLGPDPVRSALEYLLDCTEEPPSPSCSCHINPPCYDCVDYGGLRDAIAGARKALTDTEPK